MRYKIEKIKKFTQEELRESMEDAMEDAKEQMEHQLEEGFLPEITVPLKYKEAISKGITKTSCWLNTLLNNPLCKEFPMCPKPIIAILIFFIF